MTQRTIAIIGAGPAGLAAAEMLAGKGHAVTLYDAMPSVGRKFLLAGKSGLNITHSEDFTRFVQRFSPVESRLADAVTRFPPEAVRAWAADLGTETFVGSSGRVFPKVMKASPLLRAWLARLTGAGVAIRTRHRFTGFGQPGEYLFDTPDGALAVHCDAALLAMGGASWPRLGSDAAWVAPLARRGIAIAPFRAANCGFDVAWSELFRERFSGTPVKSVIATSTAGAIPGEFVISHDGIEGSLIYAHAAALRDMLEDTGTAVLTIDLSPGRSHAQLAAALARQDAKASFSTRVRKAAGLDGVKAALLRECADAAARSDPQALGTIIKALPLPVLRPRPIAEAISSAGGIGFAGLDDHFMLKATPGLFAAGEMLDWEAPTGGYLLTACMATGRAAAEGMDLWLRKRHASVDVAE